MERKFEPVMSPGAQQPLRNSDVRTIDRGTVAIDQNRVLRNTYWLLGLSLLPTVAGAMAGMSFNFIGLFRAAPIMTPILMFAVMIGSLFVVTRLRNSAWGVAALFGFTFIAGLMADADPHPSLRASAMAGSWWRCRVADGGGVLRPCGLRERHEA